jgi:pilus assembly protein CpaB
MARSIAGGGAAPSRLNRKFLVVAVLLAVLSAVLVYARISAPSNSSSSKTGGVTQTVVVAKTAIQPRTLLTADQLEVKTVSADSVVVGAYGTVADAIGKTVKYPIAANGQITTSNVIDTSRPATDASLSLVVPAGKRAMSISASQVSNAGGLILPGDFVDIIWMCCDGTPLVTKTILHNVQVLAVAQSVVDAGPVASTTPGAGTDTGTAPVAAGSGKPIPDASTVTVLVSSNEAERLFMAEQTGKLRYDLRGVSDQDVTDPGLVKIYDLLSPAELAGLPDALKPPAYKGQ